MKVPRFLLLGVALIAVVVTYGPIVSGLMEPSSDGPSILTIVLVVSVPTIAVLIGVAFTILSDSCKPTLALLLGTVAVFLFLKASYRSPDGGGGDGLGGGPGTTGLVLWLVAPLVYMMSFGLFAMLAMVADDKRRNRQHHMKGP